MRLGQLYDAMVRTEGGDRLGAVHEIYAEGDRVEALGVGAANFLERLLGRRRGLKVPWDAVRKIEGKTITVADRRYTSRSH
jgi:sporulation protein YlmC with PRC-barrel domain